MVVVWRVHSHKHGELGIFPVETEALRCIRFVGFPAASDAIPAFSNFEHWLVSRSGVNELYAKRQELANVVEMLSGRILRRQQNELEARKRELEDQLAMLPKD